MSFIFNQFPVFYKKVGVFLEFDKKRNNEIINVVPTIALLIGQKLSSGTATAGEVVLVGSLEDSAAYFGKNSMLHAMFETFFKASPYTRVFGLPMADAADSVAATGKYAFAGTATASGTYHAYIAGKYHIACPVVAGESANTIAARFKSKVDELFAMSSLPVSGTVLLGDVTLTCTWKGTTGNEIFLADNWYPGQTTPAGITVTITQMASGATDPDITNPLVNLASEQYTDVVNPYTDATNMDAIEEHLAAKWEALVGKEGISYAALKDTFADLSTYGDGRNSPFVSMMPAKDFPTPTWIIATAVCGRSCSHSDPAKPRTNGELVDVIPPKKGQGLTDTQLNALLVYSGFSTYQITPDNTVLIGNLTTMYQVNENNVIDLSFHRHATIKILSAVRYDLVAFFQGFLTWKLAPDDSEITGDPEVMTTQKAIDLAYARLFLMQKEKAWLINVEKNKDLILSGINADNQDRIDIRVPPDCIRHVNQVGILAQFKG